MVHNKLTLNTGFDLDILNFELGEITDFDMSDFDFNIDFDAEIEKELPQNTSKEVNTESFGDENFEHTCPRCNFKFNG